MDGLYLFAALSFVGVRGATVSEISLNVTDSMPAAGNARVDLVCTYSVAPPSEIRRVYIDKFKSPHEGWKTVAEFNIEAGTKEFVGEGLDFAGRAELTTGTDTTTLTFTSVDCDDTGRYKCDMSETHNRRVTDIGEKPLDVQENGKTCSGAPSIAFNLLSTLSIIIACLLR